MKILVAVKRVVDYNVKVRAKADGSGVETANVKMSMNPFDEIAVEEAVRLQEAGKAKEIVAVSLGVAACQDTLRTALAMGADRGILVETDAELQPLAVAKLLKAVVEKEKPDWSFSASRRLMMTPIRPARCWRRCWAGRRAPSPPRSKCGAGNQRHPRSRWRSGNGGAETAGLVTTDLRLNEPRFVKLPNIMKAKKKPLDVLKPAIWALMSRRA
jgi:electron transfer flavoprotein beta subunit